MSTAQQAAKGAAWMIVTSLGARAIGVVGTLVITRFLSDDLMGQTAVAAIISFSFGWFTTWGFGQYAVVFGRGDDATEVTWHATVAYNALGLVSLGALLAFAGPVCDLIDVPEAAHYIPGLAVAVFIKRIGAMPERVLARRLQFRSIGLAAATGEIGYAIVAVSLAARGWGGDAIVVGNLVQASLTLLLLVRASGTKEWLTPARLRWQRFKDMLRFGVPLAIQGIAHMAGRYWDKPTVAYLFGADVAGRYNLAYNLADVPAIYIGEQLALVLLPSMASLSPERRPRALERATALLSLIIFPLAIGLGLVATPLVALVLTPEWQGVAPLLVVLTVLSVFRPITWVLSAFMEAQDRTSRLMVLELIKLVVLIGGFFVLRDHGPRWAATSVGIAYGLNAIAGIWLVSYEGPSPRRLVLGFMRPLLACAAMAGAVLGLRELIAGNVPLGVELVLEIAAGAIAYVVAALVFCRSTALDLIQLVKGVVKRKRSGGDEAP